MKANVHRIKEYNLSSTTSPFDYDTRDFSVSGNAKTDTLAAHITKKKRKLTRKLPKKTKLKKENKEEKKRKLLKTKK